MSTVSTIYGSVDSEIMNKFAQIQLLACDVDGVFSDGRVYMGNNGEELKAFHTKDGYGLKAIMQLGVEVAIITGRSSNIVKNRFSALGVKHIIQGETDKITALGKLQKELAITAEHTCAIGDDIPDTGMFELANVKAAPCDAHPLVIAQANYTTRVAGGLGCVRELCDLIMSAKGHDQRIRAASI